jgi:hypothetical protein
MKVIQAHRVGGLHKLHYLEATCQSPYRFDPRRFHIVKPLAQAKPDDIIGKFNLSLRNSLLVT